MIEQWQPASASNASLPKADQLQQLPAALVNSDSAEPSINESALDAALLQQAKLWTQLNEEQWADGWGDLDDQTLWNIALFYVLAEQQLDDWQLADKNPAIWVFRMLKKRGTQVPKDQIKAIKKLTDNRFIPYGSVL